MNNPPAFPVPIPVEVLAELRRMGRQDVINSLATGMKLRDYFAAAALSHFELAHHLPGETNAPEEHRRTRSNYIQTVAAQCYEVADAMLAQREKESA